jgi:hypothetical protein
MADQIIDIPGVGQVAFPDTMSDDEIVGHAHRLTNEHLASVSSKPLPSESNTFGRNLAGTAGTTAKGIAEGMTIDPLKALYQTVRHPIDTVSNLATEGAQAVAHPIDTAQQIGTAMSDPETGGRTIGGLLTMLLAPRVPVKAPLRAVAGMAERNPEAVGSALGGAVGSTVGSPAVGALVGQGLSKVVKSVAGRLGTALGETAPEVEPIASMGSSRPNATMRPSKSYGYLEPANEPATLLNRPSMSALNEAPITPTTANEPLVASNESAYDRWLKATQARDVAVMDESIRKSGFYDDPKIVASGGHQSDILPRDVSALVPLDEPSPFTFEGQSTNAPGMNTPGAGDVGTPSGSVDTRPFYNPEVSGDPVGGLARSGASQSSIKSRAAMLKAFTDAMDDPRK